MLLFENDKYEYSHQDVKDEMRYAIECNPHPQVNDFNSTVDKIIACIPGANDEENWYWLVTDKTGDIWYISGGCDYTGWDCQSHLNYIKVDTNQSPELQFEEYDYSNRPIRKHFSSALVDSIAHNIVLKGE